MKAKILKKFEEEVAELERELHHELPKEIQRARELGDLRENAEYQAAKDRQGIVNARRRLATQQAQKKGYTPSTAPLVR